MRRPRKLITGMVAAFYMWTAGMAYSGILDSKHNLSMTGQIQDRSTDTSQVCIFCHTPHDANPAVPAGNLWNKDLSSAVYDIYSSSTMRSTPNQPSGYDKLCLGCHDGTMAVNMLLNNPSETGGNPPAMGYGNEISIDGKIQSSANLETDLSNDHPSSTQYPHYSNPYFSGQQNNEVADPGDGEGTSIGLPLNLGEVKCTSCHDPHDSSRENFLRKDNAFADLCLTCHTKEDYDLSSHKYPNSAQMQENCMECHKTHAGAPDNKLTKLVNESLCFSCHSAGGKASTDIESDFSGTATGVPGSGSNLNTHHDIRLSDQNYSGARIKCGASCHNPHKVNSTQKTVADPDPDDGTVPTTNNEFCMDCHDNSYPASVTPPSTPLVNIDDTWRSDKHGEGTSGGHHGNITLRSGSGYSTGDILKCTDCHDQGHGTTNIAQLKTTIYSKDGTTPLQSDSGSTFVEVTDIESGNTNALTNGKNWCSTCHPNPMNNKKDSKCLDCHYKGSKF